MAPSSWSVTGSVSPPKKTSRCLPGIGSARHAEESKCSSPMAARWRSIENTDVDLLSDSLLRVQAGRIRLSIARGASRARLSRRRRRHDDVDPLRRRIPDRRATPGRSNRTCVVTVLRGTAELESAGRRTSIRAGLEARASARHANPRSPTRRTSRRGTRSIAGSTINSAARTSARSAQYLPAELRHYGGAFDRRRRVGLRTGLRRTCGIRVVAVGWRPYYHGGWSFYGSFGWTWVGGGRWTWPTHHYGRWGFNTGRWFWIPGRRWGAGMGVLGQRARLSRLVPARIRQPPGHRHHEHQCPTAATGGAAWTVLPRTGSGHESPSAAMPCSPQTLNLVRQFAVHAARRARRFVRRSRRANANRSGPRRIPEAVTPCPRSTRLATATSIGTARRVQCRRARSRAGSAVARWRRHRAAPRTRVDRPSGADERAVGPPVHHPLGRTSLGSTRSTPIAAADCRHAMKSRDRRSPRRDGAPAPDGRRAVGRRRSRCRRRSTRSARRAASIRARIVRPSPRRAVDASRIAAPRVPTRVVGPTHRLRSLHGHWRRQSSVRHESSNRCPSGRRRSARAATALERRASRPRAERAGTSGPPSRSSRDRPGAAVRRAPDRAAGRADRARRRDGRTARASTVVGGESRASGAEAKRSLTR